MSCIECCPCAQVFSYWVLTRLAQRMGCEFLELPLQGNVGRMSDEEEAECGRWLQEVGGCSAGPRLCLQRCAHTATAAGYYGTWLVVLQVQ